MCSALDLRGWMSVELPVRGYCLMVYAELHAIGYGEARFRDFRFAAAEI